MKTLTFNFPELTNVNEHEIKMIIAGEYYRRGTLSLGQAAELVGVSKRTFIETMGNYGYSVFGDDTEEILWDIKHA